MSFFGKTRPGQGPALPERRIPPGKIQPATAMSVANHRTTPPMAAASVAQKAGRQSNGLKEFLWQLEGIGHGHLLDIGPARQTTSTFFIARRFTLSTQYYT